MSKTTVRITATGGTQFHVSRDGTFLGQMQFGSLDSDGQYEQDDDEIVESAREQFGFAATAEVIVS